MAHFSQQVGFVYCPSSSSAFPLASHGDQKCVLSVFQTSATQGQAYNQLRVMLSRSSITACIYSLGPGSRSALHPGPFCPTLPERSQSIQCNIAHKTLSIILMKHSFCTTQVEFYGEAKMSLSQNIGFPSPSVRSYGVENRFDRQAGKPNEGVWTIFCIHGVLFVK